MSLVSILRTCAFGLVLTRPAVADLFGLETAVSFRGGESSTGSGPLICSASGSATAMCGFSAPVLGAGPQIVTETATASSVAKYGFLKSDLHFDTQPVGYPPINGVSASASTRFFDTLTVYGYSGTGFIGYHFIGTAGDYVNEFRLNGRLRPGSTPIGGYTSELFEFSAGIAFLLDVGLKGAILNSPGDSAGGVHLSLTLDQIFVYDADLHPLANYTLATASGTEYAAVGAVPEPTSALLMGSVAVAFGWMIRHRRRAFGGG